VGCGLASPCAAFKSECGAPVRCFPCADVSEGACCACTPSTVFAPASSPLPDCRSMVPDILENFENTEPAANIVIHINKGSQRTSSAKREQDEGEVGGDGAPAPQRARMHPALPYEVEALGALQPWVSPSLVRRGQARGGRGGKGRHVSAVVGVSRLLAPYLVWPLLAGSLSSLYNFHSSALGTFTPVLWGPTLLCSWDPPSCALGGVQAPEQILALAARPAAALLQPSVRSVCLHLRTDDRLRVALPTRLADATAMAEFRGRVEAHLEPLLQCRAGTEGTVHPGAPKVHQECTSAPRAAAAVRAGTEGTVHPGCTQSAPGMH